MSLTFEQQNRILIQSACLTGSGRFSVIAKLVFIALLIATAIVQHPFLIMISMFISIVAFASRDTFKHLQNAIKALETGNQVASFAQISIEAPLDDNQYFVSITDRAHQTWKFEFIPQGWQPKEGIVEVSCYYLDNLAWPVLLISKEGFMVPRYQPKRLLI